MGNLKKKIPISPSKRGRRTTSHCSSKMSKVTYKIKECTEMVKSLTNLIQCVHVCLRVIVKLIQYLFWLAVAFSIIVQNFSSAL